MNEYLVEWALLREQNYLQQCIDLPLERKVCQQFTTNFGRLDFAHRIKNDGFLITELETIIDSNAKLSYCIEQVKSYQNIRFTNTDNHLTAILFANQTKARFVKELVNFSSSFNVKLYDYDLEKVKKIYADEIQKSLLTSGVPLSNPVAMNLTHLASFNRFFIPFYETKKDVLSKLAFKKVFPVIDSGKTETVFNVIWRGALYFDLIIKEKENFILTDYGKRFRDNLNAIGITDGVKKIDLSLEQQRVLIESLLKGDFYEKKSKTNIYYFLKFISLTDGEWIPRGRNIKEQAKIDFVNSFFKMNYTEGSLADWLCFTCNHCEELNLIERVKTTSYFDRAIMTSFGSRILNYLELDIHLKREKIQIPFQLL